MLGLEKKKSNKAEKALDALKLPQLLMPTTEDFPKSSQVCSVHREIYEAVGLGYALFDEALTLIDINSLFENLIDQSLDLANNAPSLKSVFRLFMKAAPSLDTDNSSKYDEFISRFITAFKAGQTDFPAEMLELPGEKIFKFQSFPIGKNLAVTCHDVTEAENKARILEASDRISNSGYWTFNFRTGKTKFSEYITSRLSAIDLKKIEKNGLFGIIHKEDLPALMEPWSKTLQTGEKFDVTYRVNTDFDGTVWQRTVGEVQYDAHGRKSHFVGVVTDISEDVKMRSELTEVQSAARAKNEFLARMSHELKTPLNAIIGMCDALDIDELPDDQVDTVKYISKAADDLNAMLTQMLSHAKLSSGQAIQEPTRVRVNDFLTKFKAKWGSACETKGLTLVTKLRDDVPEAIFVDPETLRDCLDNLMSNALKFTDTGDIRVLFAATTPKSTEENSDNSLIIAIKDSGCGMDTQTLNTLFTPFGPDSKTRERAHDGLGLGMVNARRQIENLGGSINVDSTLEQGTTYILKLPLTSLPDSAVKTQDENVNDAPTDISDENTSAAPEKLDLSALRVLCVEDNPVNQAVVKKMIHKDVAGLEFAHNGSTALEMLPAGNFDFVLMDIHMPIMDGIEATLKIRQSGADWSDIPIIALTADPDYQQKRLCRNIGMDDALAKPFKRAELIKIIERLKSVKSPRQPIAQVA